MFLEKESEYNSLSLDQAAELYFIIEKDCKEIFEKYSDKFLLWKDGISKEDHYVLYNSLCSLIKLEVSPCVINGASKTNENDTIFHKSGDLINKILSHANII